MSLSSIDRRHTLGLLGLVALGGSGTLSACSGDGDPVIQDGPDPDVLGDIEVVSSEVKRAAGDPSVVPEVVAGLRVLAGGLYDGVAAEPGNVVLSPYSVLVALGMTLTGAAGTTAEEMRAVLGAGDLGDRWHKGVNALSAHVDGLAGTQERADGSEAELTVATANQLFGQRDVAWEDAFVDHVAKEYGAPLRAVDFEGASAQARQLINDWVEQQTRDRSVDLVPEGVLDPMTRLVLVNAIHLKAPWEHPFDKGLTARGTFRRADGKEVEADMMRRPDISGALASGEGWRAAVVPYAGGRLAMTVVLPDEGSFDAVERVVADGGFTTAALAAQPSAVDLTLPRWTFRTAASLKDLLVGLGMPSAFAGADFTPMTAEDLDLVISEVLHQGFIAVDEEGTEAAAATAVVMAETSAPIVEPLVVDRPFLFVIHDLEHHAPLFVGRVVDPTG
jgi:serpin B